jgi:hypothetical protein
MWHDSHSSQFNFKFSQCNLLDELTTTTSSDIPSTRCKKNQKKHSKNDQIQEQQIARPMDVLEKSVSLIILMFIFNMLIF